MRKNLLLPALALLSILLPIASILSIFINNYLGQSKLFSEDFALEDIESLNDFYDAIPYIHFSLLIVGFCAGIFGLVMAKKKIHTTARSTLFFAFSFGVAICLFSFLFFSVGMIEYIFKF